MNAEYSSELKNKNGQIMQRKGIECRLRLIQATAELLRQKSVAELKVIDIATAAGTSKPNFYLYFDDVLDVVLAAVQDISMETPALSALIKARWPAAEHLECSRRFVQSYLEHWLEHAHVLRARNTLVAEGDPRFWDAELQATKSLLNDLALKIAEHQKTGSSNLLHPMSAAGAFLAMLERLGAYGMIEDAPSGITRRHLIDAVAFMLTGLLGSTAPVSKSKSS